MASTVRDLTGFGYSGSTTLPMILRTRQMAMMRSSVGSEAPDWDMMQQMGGGTDYIRGGVDRHPVYQSIVNQSREYYGLSDSDFVVLTNKGVVAPDLALQRVAELGQNVGTLIVVGTPYFETGKLVKSKGESMFGSIIRVGNASEAQAMAKQIWRDGGVESPDVVIMVDPIESSPVMQVSDVPNLTKELGSIPIEGRGRLFIMSDISTCGGLDGIMKVAGEAVRNSGDKVNFVASQSMMKFFSWGFDNFQLGQVMALGPDVGIGSDFADINWWWDRRADPDVPVITTMPPIDREYMEFRGRTISRNAMIQTDVIAQDCQNISIVYPGNNDGDRVVLEKIGYSGPYYYIQMPNIRSRDAVLENAKKHSNSLGGLVVGTSYGQDRPRIHGIGVKEGRAFLRVVPGTQDVGTTYLTAKRLAWWINSTIIRK